MIIHLFYEVVVEYLLFHFGRIFVFCVTLGRFPSPDQADQYGGILKVVGFIVWIVIVLGISFWKYS